MPSLFQPDYRNLELAARNQKPPRLPFYEHYINLESMEGLTGQPLVPLLGGTAADRLELFARIGRFFRDLGYDTVSHEVGVTEILPGGGALGRHQPGVIQTRADFERYPWDDLPRLFWELAAPQFDALEKTMIPGMKAVGGIGNGVFEISQDLVGYQRLCYLQVDDPELFQALFVKIGDLLVNLWTTFIARYHSSFAVCRIGDDMGFKTAPLLAPDTLRDHVVPQYRRIISIVHDGGRPFLLHSCGCIFAIMDDLIDAGINAKHSNEDAIAPYDQWIMRYGGRIGLFGGIDTDRLCRMSPDDVYHFTLEEATRFRRIANGYALGSGNSIPPYVPPDGYRAMLAAGLEIRRRETV